jgi:hypothetical protein
MGGLLGLVVLIADIVAIVDCAKSRKPGDQKALWIALVVLAPLVGVILYYLLGRK